MLSPRVKGRKLGNLAKSFIALFSLSLFGLSSRERISEDLRFPDFRFHMRRTRLARKGNREAALSASQFRAVLEQPSCLTAMQAKVQVAITRGLFAARDAVSCAGFPAFAGFTDTMHWLPRDVTRRPSADNSPMFTVAWTDKPRPLIKTRDANHAKERDRVSAN